MWKRLDSKCQRPMVLQTPKKVVTESIEQNENSNPQFDSNSQPVAGNDLSFQSLVEGIASEQRQNDVTFPYYFICLLHLANEKVCKIFFIHLLSDYSLYISFSL